MYFTNLFITSSISEQEANLDEIILEYVPTPIIKDPIILILLGAVLTIIFGVFFARIMQLKLQGWEREKIPTLPLENVNTTIGWTVSFTGITLFFTGWLQLLDFAPEKSLIASFVIALISGILMWRTIRNLLSEVDAGEVKEFDDYF